MPSRAGKRLLLATGFKPRGSQAPGILSPSPGCGGEGTPPQANTKAHGMCGRVIPAAEKAGSWPCFNGEVTGSFWRMG